MEGDPVARAQLRRLTRVRDDHGEPGRPTRTVGDFRPAVGRNPAAAHQSAVVGDVALDSLRERGSTIFGSAATITTGVIANLAVNVALHTLFDRTDRVTAGPLDLQLQ